MSYLEQLSRIVAGETGVPASLLVAVIMHESGGDTEARGAAGEIGLMQLMPATARMLGFDPTRLEDPFYNVRAGAKYLAQQARRYKGDWVKAVSAYNAGTATTSNLEKYVLPILRAAGLPSEGAGPALAAGGFFLAILLGLGLLLFQKTNR